jgi:2'-5' RNA ligase
MYAIISELDPESSSTVNGLWLELRRACGLTAIYEVATPHFTWLVAEELKIQKAAPILSQISDQASEMTLHTFGLGIFSGEKPVLYLPLVKSREMIALHEMIWDQIQPYSKEAKLYYSPKLWVPHITLALNDVTRDTLACAVNAIAFEPIELFVKVDNVALAEHEEDQPGHILSQYRFSN